MLRAIAFAALPVLCACSTPPLASAPETPVAAVASIVERPKTGDGQLQFDLASGTYNCELGLKVDVERNRQQSDRINIGWTGARYQLHRDHSFSGLPRYEDQINGLVWIDLPWKSVLLDGRTHKPLANDCKIT
jgi:hypothetical protein